MNFPADLITHEGSDRGGKKCLCSRCGLIAVCRPEFDFYSVDVSGALVCSRCLFPAFPAFTPSATNESTSAQK